MRRYAGRGWKQRPLAAPSTGARQESGAPDRGPDGFADGQIVDLAEPGYVPERDRLTLRHPTRLRVTTAFDDWPDVNLAWLGEIVDDRVDGRRIYPDPPRQGRSVDRTELLLDRLCLPMLPFILLAWVQACIVVADFWWVGKWNGLGVALLVLRIGYVCGLSLLPAGVLLWRAQAWRSAPLVFFGAILWTTPPALAGTGWWLTLRSPGLTDSYGHDMAVALAAASVLACLGPAAIAFGLEHVRRSPAEWFSFAARRTGLVGALLLVLNVGRWLPVVDTPGVPTLGGGIDTFHLAGSVAGAAEPIALLGLSLLACSCISAVAGEEPQRRLWQCCAAGATVLLGVSFYDLTAGDLLSGFVAGGPPALMDRGWFGVAAGAILLAGGGLVLLGFSSPVWSSTEDADGPGRGAPDEIFAWGSAWGAIGSEPIPMSAVVSVAAGANHALALDMYGRVGSWGDNSMGQTDVPEDLSGAVAVAAGDRFSLALRDDGTVAAWGSGDLGQTAVPPGLAGVTAIAAGKGFALALRSDGSVAGWGDESSGAVPVPPWLAGVTAISAGESHGLALRLDGSVVAWGDDGFGQSSVPRLGRATAISAGGNFSLALMADGSVAGWGDGSYGQLDIPAELGKVVAISAGAFHALALRANGDVVGWGGGSGRQDEAAHPWHLVDFKAVAAGNGFSLAIRAA
jgi:hypothetical protein